jgi:transcriptional regulator with XRE-family HTH domain
VARCGLSEVVGARIREMRVARDLSQEELAERLSTTQSEVSKTECGRDVRLSTVEAAAAVFGVDIVIDFRERV